MRASATVLIAALTSVALACTEFRIKTTNNQYVVARTMEFSEELVSNVIVEPKGIKHTASIPDSCRGAIPLSWNNKNKLAYLDALNNPVVADGMNTAGLSFAALLFPGFTKYQEPKTPQECSYAVSSLEIGSYILSEFETVAEVTAELEANTFPLVWDGKIDGEAFPLHYSIQDKRGNGIIIEYTESGRKVHNNTLGIMTNSPPYEWHMQNIRNYIFLSKYIPEPLQLGDFKFETIGQGSGLLGVPGDFTPPSRFIRTLMLLYFSTPAKNSLEAANLAFHLINAVDIPHGTSSDRETEMSGYTQWSVVKDINENNLYIRGYKDLSVRVINLDELNVSQPHKIVIENKFLDGVVDITAKLQERKTEL